MTNWGELVIDSVLVRQMARQVVIAPLMFKGVPLGAMVLASVEPFSPSVELLVRHFQTDLGLALSNALSHDRLERLAALDPLTDAYNRRFGLVRLQEEFGRSMRVSGPLGVLMVDLDHFKAVNDTYGHLVGDRVLRAAAAAIRRVTREGDVLIRYGGEEFLVVVPGAGIEDVRELAERVRRAVAATEVMDGERRISVTASVGASTYPEHDVSSALELVEVADTALYASKESGRDRVTMA
ncbi:MAG TPA: GGDEF domain-containing protein [Candidatus Deferrimicrobium sp.]|nr:GGDEF domain-containing protein [Candidatus Deferrimicrobium sp.]